MNASSEIEELNLRTGTVHLALAASRSRQGGSHMSVLVDRVGLWGILHVVSLSAQIIAAMVVLTLCRNTSAAIFGLGRQPASNGSSVQVPYVLTSPLRAWLVGYTLGCIASLPLFIFKKKQQQQQVMAFALSSNLHQSTVVNDTTTIVMQRLRAFLECFFAVWFVLGTVWVFGRPPSLSVTVDADLHRLCVIFLFLSCMRYAMPCILYCCACAGLAGPSYSTPDYDNSASQHQAYPWQSSQDHIELNMRGASPHTILALPVYKVVLASSIDLSSVVHHDHHYEDRNLRCSSIALDDKLAASCRAVRESSSHCKNCIHHSKDYCMIKVNDNRDEAAHEKTMVMSKDHNSVCSICLRRYKDNAMVKGLSCSHIFHAKCLDQWLAINASCPLCKFALPPFPSCYINKLPTTCPTWRGRSTTEACRLMLSWLISQVRRSDEYY